MKAVVKTAPERGAEIRDDWPERDCGPGEIRVRVAAASVCGTDRELFEYTNSAKAFGLTFPVVLGHECAGTVVEVGEGIEQVTIGGHVALESHRPCGHCLECRTGNAHNCANLTILGMHFDGAFAESVVVPETICYPLPEAMELETAALLEPAGVAMHAVQRAAQTVPGQRVLISGSGPVGIVLTRLVTLMGAADVVVVEPNPYRRGLAEKYGATTLTPDDAVVELCQERPGPAAGSTPPSRSPARAAPSKPCWPPPAARPPSSPLDTPADPCPSTSRSTSTRRASPCVASSAAACGTPGSPSRHWCTPGSSTSGRWSPTGLRWTSLNTRSTCSARTPARCC